MYTPPFPILSKIIEIGINILLVAMFIRAIASWFRMDERIPFIRFLARITDPFIEPCRRLFGTVWMLDVGWLAAFFFLSILQTLLLQSLPPGW